MKRLTQKTLRAIELDQTLLAFDFDGTLSPIVRHPSMAGTSPELLPLLKRLQASGMQVGVITGRSIKDVRPLLRFKPDFLVGNHGMEGLKKFQPHAKKAREVCRRWVKELKKDWPSDPGVFLEDKKESLSLHYREARDTKGARILLQKLIAELHPRPRVIGGKLLFNLIPTGSPHKGLALKEVMRLSKMKQALFAGDDDTDEDGFIMKGRIISVRVGRKSGSAAKYFIPTQRDMVSLLRGLGR